MSISQIIKIEFNGKIACIGEELREYLNIKNTFNEDFLNKKGLCRTHDYEFIETFLISNKVGQSHRKYISNSKSLIIYQSGIKVLIAGRRQTESIEVAKRFNIDLNFIKEREYLKIIKESFSDLKGRQQYYVEREKGRGYYIDLYFEEINVAVECDEFGHLDREEDDEMERQSYIEEKLGCTFVRFNPDDKNFSIGKIIKEVRESSENNKKEFKPIEFFEFDDISMEMQCESVGSIMKDTILNYIRDIQFELQKEDYMCELNILTKKKNGVNYISYAETLLFCTNNIIKTNLEYGENSTGLFTIIIDGSKYDLKHNICITFSKNIINIQVPSCRTQKSEDKNIRDYIRKVREEFDNQ